MKQHRLCLENPDQAAQRMHDALVRLFPIHRTMAGEGLRQTLAIIQESIALTVTEVATGTEVLDWVVPQEWLIRDAYVKDVATGERLIDYANSNLHVVSHSQAIRKTMSWHELRPHLHTNAQQPDAIPYQTAFFREAWGFCLSHNQCQQLDRDPSRQVEVVIDAEFHEGSLSFGEFLIPGQSSEEFLIHTHICHPSLANDNLSGMVVATELAQQLAKRENRFTYRFVFTPATIGAITWLSLHRAVPMIRHGLVLTLLGDAAPLTYKRSARESAEIDRIAANVVQHRAQPGRARNFEPWGYDERQYCSPAFNLPVGCLMRSVHNEFPEYHTSADSPSFVQADALADSLSAVLEIVSAAESNHYYRHLHPAGEPMLGRRGFFDALTTQTDANTVHKAALWLLNRANSARDLLLIAEEANLPLRHFVTAAEILVELDLLERV